MFAIAPRSITIRIELPSTPGSFGLVATALGKVGADLGAIDLVSSSAASTVRDLSVGVQDPEQAKAVVDALEAIPGVRVLRWADRLFLLHLGGKLRIESKVPVDSRHVLSMVYTPGVAEVCRAIARDPDDAHRLTMKRNTVAIVSDGSAVLGLGNIGPEAALPVMEGKAMLFRQFAGVDAVPLCVGSQDPEDIIQFCRMISPTFGGINLEDISSPRCFEIEEALRRDLSIPVVHDDQHGTAVAVLAALLNSLKVVGKKIGSIKLALLGAGAAGTACAKLLRKAGVRNIVAVDRDGIVGPAHRAHANPGWKWLARNTNRTGLAGGIMEALEGADVFLGVSGPDLLPEAAVERMASDPIVFAMANPTPEIPLDIARRHARVVASGRSDQPNQINNVLVFPGLFRGLLDCRASTVNEAMLIAAARALAAMVPAKDLGPEYILPSVFNPKVAETVARAVVGVATRAGLARRTPAEGELSSR